MASQSISSYRLIVRSGSSTTYQEDLISLYNSKKAHIANLLFTDHEPLGKNTNAGYTTVVYPRNVYMHALDMLRNEKPVYFVEDNAIEGGIRTSTGELVGEGE